jgi:hypothetical protein
MPLGKNYTFFWVYSTLMGFKYLAFYGKKIDDVSRLWKYIQQDTYEKYQ